MLLITNHQWKKKQQKKAQKNQEESKKPNLRIRPCGQEQSLWLNQNSTSTLAPMQTVGLQDGTSSTVGAGGRYRKVKKVNNGTTTDTNINSSIR